MTLEQKEALRTMLREVPLDAGGELSVQRPLFEQFLGRASLAADVRLTETTLGGVPSIEISVSDSVPEARIIYLHGGVFALGSARSSAGLASALARHARATVVSVDYRLAPEFPHPAATEDTLAVYRAALQAGAAPERIAFLGESAGGALALAGLVAARNAGLPQPAAATLFSPWIDLSLSGASMAAKAEVDLTLTPQGLRRRVADYAVGIDPSDPAVSPLFADLRGIAPLLIQSGSNEVLLDDATRLAAAAAAADVPVRLEITPGVPHVFQAFAGLLDEGEEALARAGEFLKEHLGTAARASGLDG